MELVNLLTSSVITPLQPLQHELFKQHQIEVWIKRDDLNHPVIQGNKWHKLKHNLQYAKQHGKDTLITFGGAYSNHIAATAAAGKAFGFKTLGFIRGDELANSRSNWSPTLREAEANGMQFRFISRSAYRQKTSIAFEQPLQAEFPNSLILPEGGTNQRALIGFETVITQLQRQCPDWTHLYTAVGTGGTLAGLAKMSHDHLASQRDIIGIATLKNAHYLKAQMTELVGFNDDPSNHPIRWQLRTQYHGGGYAKTTEACIADQLWFERHFGILLDPIYTNKMVHGFLEELRQQKIPPKSKVILYHSGGLQGRPEGVDREGKIKTG